MPLLHKLNISRARNGLLKTVHDCLPTSTGQFGHRSAFSAGVDVLGFPSATVLVLGKRRAITPSTRAIQRIQARQAQPFCCQGAKRQAGIRLGPLDTLSYRGLPLHPTCQMVPRLVAGKNRIFGIPSDAVHVASPDLQAAFFKKKDCKSHQEPRIGNDQPSRSQPWPTPSFAPRCWWSTCKRTFALR